MTETNGEMPSNKKQGLSLKGLSLSRRSFLKKLPVAVLGPLVSPFKWRTATPSESLAMVRGAEKYSGFTYTYAADWVDYNQETVRMLKEPEEYGVLFELAQAVVSPEKDPYINEFYRDWYSPYCRGYRIVAGNVPLIAQTTVDFFREQISYRKVNEDREYNRLGDRLQDSTRDNSCSPLAAEAAYFLTRYCQDLPEISVCWVRGWQIAGARDPHAWVEIRERESLHTILDPNPQVSFSCQSPEEASYRFWKGYSRERDERGVKRENQVVVQAVFNVSQLMRER